MRDFPAFSTGLISRCRPCLFLTYPPRQLPGELTCLPSPTTRPVSASLPVPPHVLRWERLRPVSPPAPRPPAWLRLLSSLSLVGPVALSASSSGSEPSAPSTTSLACSSLVSSPDRALDCLGPWAHATAHAPSSAPGSVPRSNLRGVWTLTGTQCYEQLSFSPALFAVRFGNTLVATPDYPVAAGQKVHLHCFASTIPNYVNWTWQQLDLNQTWKVVHSGMNLTLTKPEQSGTYRCHAMARLSESVSATHMVYIISMHATVGEKLGIAAFVLSFLALIICLATLFWLGWQRLGDTLTTSNTTAKGFPGPEKSPKGGLPKTDCEADVYMNYTSTNQAYTDLDPTNMTADNVYSCLS
ncbi:uncharacterized protein ABDE67_015186 [Symphorus nematophorus]